MHPSRRTTRFPLVRLLRRLGDRQRYPLDRVYCANATVSDSMELQSCTNCGSKLQIVHSSNPCLIRCPDCGIEEWSLCAPPTPEDPNGDADGILQIHSFNHREREAALTIRNKTKWMPQEVVTFIRTSQPMIFRSFRDGLHHLVELRDALLSIGVSCTIVRLHEPPSADIHVIRWSKDASG